MNLRSIAISIVKRLQEAGYEAFWVGGCVRDELLGREPHDFDVATSARPDEIEALFPHTIPVGRQFGVILAVIEGSQFQIATFREDVGYRDGRHPESVRFADAKADASRRDFTVNGLFFDPVAGTLHDWVGGGADLSKKLIRTIGHPSERFGEDHLRLLRAVRFAAQLGFEIEERTFESIRAGAALLKSVSPERIRDELLRLFSPPHAARGFVLLQQSGLMEIVFPELLLLQGCEQSPIHHPEGDVFEHVRRMLDLLPQDASTELIWSVLLHDISKPATRSVHPEKGTIHFYGHEREGEVKSEEILTRLKFPKHQINAIKTCVRNHMQFIEAPRMRKSTIRRILLHPTFDTELELHRLDSLGSNGQMECYDIFRKEQLELALLPEIQKPLITGDDLITLGFPKGPAMGNILSEIRDKQLQGELDSREDALSWAARLSKSGPDTPQQPSTPQN